jgi:hypothetical protein
VHLRRGFSRDQRYRVGFSYGFRPQREPHQCLDALYVAITEKRVNWILDADIEGFFDNIDREQLVAFLEPTNLRSVPDRRPAAHPTDSKMAECRNHRGNRRVISAGTPPKI